MFKIKMKYFPARFASFFWANGKTFSCGFLGCAFDIENCKSFESKEKREGEKKLAN
jgi:hypothetical protein